MRPTKGETTMPKNKQRITYRDAGVDIDAGELFVKFILPYVARTVHSARLKPAGGIGGFSGVMPLPNTSMALTAGTDGVGTKLDLAKLLGILDTVGIDLVGMCVNDILTDGAVPIFFLDYLCVGKLDPEKHAFLVKGIAEGCIMAGCALIGGETAEHPGTCPEDYFDLAGFCIGLHTDLSKRITGENIQPKMYLHGAPSSGIHSNGYSLLRTSTGIKSATPERALEILHANVPELGCTLAEEVMKPTKIYANMVARVLRDHEVYGMAHITGGGLVTNPPRILPDGCAIKIDLGKWEKPTIFPYVQRLGNTPTDDILKTFNCGIAYIFFSPEEKISGTIRIGEVIEHKEKKVFFEGKF